MKANKSKNVFFKFIEMLIWAVLGAFIALTTTAQLSTQNKAIVILAIILIMLLLFFLFTFVVSSDGKNVESNPGRMQDMSSGNKMQGNYRTASQNAQMKSEARISRNPGTQAANPLDKKPMSAQKREVRKQVKNLVLINEEGDTLLEWPLSGKTALIIGKNTEKEKVDIDLECSAYANMISKQHAVLNYTNGGWYIDDIDSKNGTRVKKMNQNSILDVKLVGTVEIEYGDIIYIANTMLQLK